MATRAFIETFKFSTAKSENLAKDVSTLLKEIVLIFSPLNIKDTGAVIKNKNGQAILIKAEPRNCNCLWEILFILKFYTSNDELPLMLASFKDKSFFTIL